MKSRIIFGILIILSFNINSTGISPFYGFESNTNSGAIKFFNVVQTNDIAVEFSIHLSPILNEAIKQIEQQEIDLLEQKIDAISRVVNFQNLPNSFLENLRLANLSTSVKLEFLEVIDKYSDNLDLFPISVDILLSISDDIVKLEEFQRNQVSIQLGCAWDVLEDGSLIMTFPLIGMKQEFNFTKFNADYKHLYLQNNIAPIDLVKNLMRQIVAMTNKRIMLNLENS